MIGADFRQFNQKCFGDQGRIVQILWNIIGNAIKFSPVDGVVQICVSNKGKFAEFSISDSGPGLDPNDLQRVFDRFWQSGKSSKSTAGLGMAISKGLVEAHDGKIWVESKKGHGCVFRFTIPFVDEV